MSRTGALPHEDVDVVLASPAHQTAARNRSVNRKLDLALLPLLSLLYLFNGLDRGNVGNAETQGKATFHDSPPSGAGTE